MIQSNIRTCILQGHQEFKVTHICTFVDCKQITRWCCVECNQKQVHNHQNPDNRHIMNTQEIHSYVMKQYEIMKKDFNQYKSSQTNILQKILKECQQIVQSLIDYKNQYLTIEQQIQNIILNFEQCLSNMQNDNFYQLDDEKINQILNIDFNNQDLFYQLKSEQSLQQPLDTIKNSLYSIEMTIKEYKDNQKKKNNTANKTIDLKDRKYIIQKIDQTMLSYFTSQLLKNEQYLAYGGSDCILKIYDIKQQKLIKEIRLDNYIYTCQFNQDSSQLFVGLNAGNVFGYDVLNDFKEIYRQQIHSGTINNIITIQNLYLITCSSDKFIIKTDIVSKEQIFKLIGHTNQVRTIDYNEKYEIIVSSDVESLKLWDCRFQSIIVSKEQPHDKGIRLIQLIKNNLNLFSLDEQSNFYKWKIDLINKDLIKLQQIRSQNTIYNFCLFNQDQYILIIGRENVKILNQQGDTLNKIEHSCKHLFQISDYKQLDNLRYIQIKSTDQIVLAIALN